MATIKTLPLFLFSLQSFLLPPLTAKHTWSPSEPLPKSPWRSPKQKEQVTCKTALQTHPALCLQQKWAGARTLRFSYTALSCFRVHSSFKAKYFPSKSHDGSEHLQALQNLKRKPGEINDAALSWCFIHNPLRGPLRKKRLYRENTNTFNRSC